MNDLIGVFTAKKDSKSLSTYLDCSEGSYCFEVKDGERLLYMGTSFEKARRAYESLIAQSS